MFERFKKAVVVEPKATRRSTGRRNKYTPKRPEEEIENEILTYLKGRVGEETSISDIGAALGFGNSESVRRYVQTLLNKGSIRRKGKKGSTTYTVHRSRVNRKRGTANKATKKVNKPQRLEKPTLSKNQSLVFEYIKRNQNSIRSYAEIGKETGVSANTIGTIVKVLLGKGVIERTGYIPGDGTQYRVVSETTAVRTEEPGPNRETRTESTNNVQFVSMVDSLVWEFVRETRNTDVLIYLTWLENKLK